MSESYHDSGIIAFPGYIDGSPSFAPIFIPAPSNPATNFSQSLYVSAGGSDGNPGTITAPFATIGAAITKRLTLSSATFITINVLTGTYTATGNTLAVPDNTGIVGVPTGRIYPVTFTGVLRIGSGVVNNSNIILSNLIINGEVAMVNFYARLSIANCVITSPGNAPSPYTGVAVSTGQNCYLKIDNSYIYSSYSGNGSAGNGVLTMTNSNSLQMNNTTVRSTVTGAQSFPVCPVLKFYQVPSVTLSNCFVISDYDQTTNNTPLLYLSTASSTDYVLSVFQSNMYYTSSAVDTTKACMYFDAAGSVTATLKATLIGNQLYSPGGNSATIITPSTNLAVTLISGGNYCATGSNGSSNISTRVSLPALSN